ncbi:hypothetical protein QWZ10_10420 [Paracoccus cavernae]|uniref:YgiT-type zinc finger protein n=2 Tax=Paracoccus cavernae TaxID=1571207 RepID=A0ABT8D856_9RHOB|nr:hypothetical protein [Paracoccus cavernae]
MAGITIRDLIAEGVALQIHCTGCGKTYVYQGDFRLRTVATPNMRIRDLQFALRCKDCCARGEVVMTIPQTVIDDIRRTANPLSPLSKAGPPLWRW